MEHLPIYHALIKTHHIISRRKISKLKSSAHDNAVYVLIRSAAKSPGLMYVEGRGESGVKAWVDDVKDLRYKDFQLLKRPALLSDAMDTGDQREPKDNAWTSTFDEVEKVPDFASEMERRAVLDWWRTAMGWKNA